MEPASKSVSVQFVRQYTITEHICPVCGTPFSGPKLRVYCTPRCVRKAAWARHGAEWNETRKAKRHQSKVRHHATNETFGGEK